MAAAAAMPETLLAEACTWERGWSLCRMISLNRTTQMAARAGRRVAVEPAGPEGREEVADLAPHGAVGAKGKHAGAGGGAGGIGGQGGVGGAAGLAGQGGEGGDAAGGAVYIAAGTISIDGCTFLSDDANGGAGGSGGEGGRGGKGGRGGEGGFGASGGTGGHGTVSEQSSLSGGAGGPGGAGGAGGNGGAGAAGSDGARAVPGVLREVAGCMSARARRAWCSPPSTWKATRRTRALAELEVAVAREARARADMAAAAEVEEPVVRDISESATRAERSRLTITADQVATVVRGEPAARRALAAAPAKVAPGDQGVPLRVALCTPAGM